MARPRRKAERSKPARSRTERSKPERSKPAPRGVERRRHPRFPVDCEVDYRAEDTFLFAYISNVSTMGIFVRTDRPEPPGTRLLLRFTPPGFDHPLELQGVVQWINPPRRDPEKSRQAGMGVQFMSLTAPTRRALIEMVRRLAYLDDDSLKPDRGAS